METPRARILRLAGAAGLVFTLGSSVVLASTADETAPVRGLASSEAVPAPLEPDTVPAAPQMLASPTTSTSTTTTTVIVPATAPPTTAPAHVHVHEHEHAPAPTSAPAPTTTTTAAPAPAPASSPPEPQETLQQRVERAYVTGVPAAWRGAIDIRLEVIEGRTSWAEGGGRIMISRSHAEGRFEHLTDVVVHEFGHQVAFEYGTHAYPGAAPEGWPEPPSNPAEAWADCVQSVFTGRANPSHGLAPCGGEQLSWARNWLQTVPAS